MPSTPPRLPAYVLSCPTEADAVASLARVFGPDRAAAEWAAACGACALEPGEAIPVEPLRRVAAALGRQGGALPALGRAIEIRLQTYGRLAARQDAAAGARA